MASSATGVANRNKYQGKEQQEDLGLNLYYFTARQYDPQLGRFWGVDPASQFPSGYNGMGNCPSNMVDPSGCWSHGIGGSAPGTRSGGNLAGETKGGLGEGPHTNWFEDPNLQTEITARMRDFVEKIKADHESAAGDDNAADANQDPEPETKDKIPAWVCQRNPPEDDSHPVGPPPPPTANMHISKAGLDLIAQFEAYSDVLYEMDGEDGYTIGYGHHMTDKKEIKQWKNKTMDKTTALEYLEKDVAVREKNVHSSVTVPLTQEQYDAVVIFRYNMSKSLVSYTDFINGINTNSMTKSIWTEYTGSRSANNNNGLLKRREAEFRVWEKGIYLKNW